MKSKKFRKNSRKQLRSKKQMKRSRKQKRTRKLQKGGMSSAGATVKRLTKRAGKRFEQAKDAVASFKGSIESRLEDLQEQLPNLIDELKNAKGQMIAGANEIVTAKKDVLETLNRIKLGITGIPSEISKVKNELEGLLKSIREKHSLQQQQQSSSTEHSTEQSIAPA